jgi:3-(methylthio)propanoyl-CoA dehydrogenase
VGRKTARDGGAVARAIAQQIEATEADLAKRDSTPSKAMLKRLKAARLAFLDAVDFVAGQTKAQPNAVFAGSVPYLFLAGTTIAGWQMARALITAEERLAEGQDAEFMKAKIATAHFYADHILNKASSLRDSIVEGADAVTAMALDSF